jgi:hypothetical protein
MLAAFLVWMIAGPLAALDIADFLKLEAGAAWDLQGQVTFLGTPSGLSGSIVIEPMVDPPVPGAVNLVVDVTGSQMPIRMRQSLTLSMTDEYLQLHGRHGQVWYSGFPVDDDKEVYLTPANILPRHVYLGTSYPYTADIEGGPVEDTMIIETVESSMTFEGDWADCIKVVFFSEDDVPVTLWMARGVGFMKLDVATTYMGNTVFLHSVLSHAGGPLNAGTVTGRWDDTLWIAENWRYHDWLGYIWPLDIGSHFAAHYGFGWSYFSGSDDNMGVYIWDVGWFWTSASTYPVFWDWSRAEFLLYSEAPGSYYFWSWVENKYIDLSP